MRALGRWSSTANARGSSGNACEPRKTRWLARSSRNGPNQSSARTTFSGAERRKPTGWLGEFSPAPSAPVVAATIGVVPSCRSVSRSLPAFALRVIVASCDRVIVTSCDFRRNPPRTRRAFRGKGRSPLDCQELRCCSAHPQTRRVNVDSARASRQQRTIRVDRTRASCAHENHEHRAVHGFVCIAT